MLPPTHYRGNPSNPDYLEYKDKIRLARERREYFEKNPEAPGAKEYFEQRKATEERINEAFKPILDALADCQRITAEDLAMRVG